MLLVAVGLRFPTSRRPYAEVGRLVVFSFDFFR